MPSIVIDSPFARDTFATPSTNGTLPNILVPAMSFCVVASGAVRVMVNANLRASAAGTVVFVTVLLTFSPPVCWVVWGLLFVMVYVFVVVFPGSFGSAAVPSLPDDVYPLSASPPSICS